MCEKCNKGKYYITTAIAYASGKPHIGNTYEVVLADAIARYKRSQGYDVFFQTGTDEHGQKIELKADEAGITPKQFVDNAAGEIKKIWDLMNTSYDKFIRTTDEDHEAQVKKIFKRLYDQGDIYKSSYEGMYCTPCESFWTESQLVDGKCPDCGREWKCSINSMTRKGRFGCAECSKKHRGKSFTQGVVKKVGSLAETMPELSKEWHPTKNGDLTPNDITAGKFKPVWWLCPKCGYECSCKRRPTL